MAAELSPPAKRAASEKGVSDGERQSAAVRWFLGRLDRLRRNYTICYAIQQSALSRSESLAVTRRALNPKTRKQPPRCRLDPQLQIFIGFKSLELARCRDPSAATPTQADVNAAAAEMIATIKPVRGRPADPLLAFHVHAFMALYRQTCGKDLQASLTRNSVYEPHIRGRMGAVLLTILRETNAAVTMTQLANIVLDAHAAGAILGKRFENYFPLQPCVDEATRMPVAQPGFQLERFEWLPPIYSS